MINLINKLLSTRTGNTIYYATNTFLATTSAFSQFESQPLDKYDILKIMKLEWDADTISTAREPHYNHKDEYSAMYENESKRCEIAIHVIDETGKFNSLEDSLKERLYKLEELYANALTQRIAYYIENPRLPSKEQKERETRYYSFLMHNVNAVLEGTGLTAHWMDFPDSSSDETFKLVHLVFNYSPKK